MAEPLTLMAVHAHPDDEASGGGILAAYADQGIRTIVVTCTNGEFGDAPGGIKPGQDGHDQEAVARQRLAELEKSARILRRQRPGNARLPRLGHGRTGSTRNRPDAFCNVPVEEVAGRIGELIDQVPPAGARHLRRPGRLPAPRPRARQPRRAGRGDGDRHPGQGLPVHDAGQQLAEDLGRAARGRRGGAAVGRGSRSAARRARSSPRQRITTTIDIRPVLDRKRAGAVRARQPDRRFLVQQAAAGRRRGRHSATSTSSGWPTRTGAPLPENDLFAGLRTGA